jgi:hypothetical protein
MPALRALSDDVCVTALLIVVENATAAVDSDATDTVLSYDDDVLTVLLLLLLSIP